MTLSPEQIERFYHAAYRRFTADPTIENEEELDYWRLCHSAHIADAMAAGQELRRQRMRDDWARWNIDPQGKL